MSFTTNIFSALGNNSNSLWPIIFKDTIMENAGRTVMSYRQGAKESKDFGVKEAKETARREYFTSAVWLGGIPFLKKFWDNTAMKLAKMPAGVDYKLLDKNNSQNVWANKNIAGVPKKVLNDLKKVADNPNLYKKLSVARFLITTGLPVVFLATMAEKLNYKFTGEEYKEAARHQAALSLKNKFKNAENPAYNIYQNSKKHEPSFKGAGLDIIMTNPVANMAVLDLNLSGGRVLNARTKEEKIEMAAKEAGLIFFIYQGGKILQKWLEKGANKLLNVPIELDSKIIESTKFGDLVRSKDTITVPKTAKQVIELLDNTKEDDKFLRRMAVDTGLVETLPASNAAKHPLHWLGFKPKGQVDGIRNPFKYVKTGDVTNLAENMKSFIKTAKESKGGVENFLKKAKWIKRGSIIANLALCSTATAYLIPKMQFAIREKLTGHSASSGIIKMQHEAGLQS